MKTTHDMRGSCIRRPGGKGDLADKLVPLFPNAELYVEPFFGAGSIFYAIPDNTYPRMAINDLDKQIVTFFRVLRDRTEEFIRVCELTPYARDEFIAALEHSDDELEEARRVWIRSRQGFAGQATAPGNWGRSDQKTWNPGSAETKFRLFREYAERLRTVAIDNVDAVEFIQKWTFEDTFIYCDPPYVTASRKSEHYEHEMTDADHRKLAEVLHAAVEAGAKVGISGYPNELYDSELYKGWRRVEFDVKFTGSQKKDDNPRRTEVFWMSYPESEQRRYQASRAPKATSKREQGIAKALARAGVVR